MLEINKNYSINNGPESIVFSSGKGNTIIGKYDSGTLSGSLEGNVLKATFHNHKNNSAGLIEFFFQEGGFQAKWKQGLEQGPMRGSWVGTLISDEVARKTKSYNIQVFGTGGEVVVGNASDYESNFNDAFDETDLDLDQIMMDSETRGQFDLPEWYEIDNLLHINGAFIDNDNECVLKIVENNTEVLNCNPVELVDSFGEQIIQLEEFYLDTDDNQIFSGYSSEKGCLFSGYINISEGEDFKIDNLKLFYKEIMINDETIVTCIYKVLYEDNEIENSDFYSDGKGFNFRLHS